MIPAARQISLTLALAAAAATGACSKADAGDSKDAETISARRAADMLHAVMEADRTAYTRNVVNRLTTEQQVLIVDSATEQTSPLRASEHWKTEHGSLPLPAQMFRMGAEQVTAAGTGFSYVLLSRWPVNDKNAPKTPVEQQGLDAVVANRGAEPFYGRETLGDKRYLTAVYADVAVAPACVSCHNDHPDSPRSDFALGDVMGGVVIRIPL